MTGTERSATEVIARKIRGGGDPDILAVEILHVLRGLGWRPTEARPLPEWKRATGTGKAPDEAARAELDEALRRCAVSPTRVHPAEPPAVPVRHETGAA